MDWDSDPELKKIRQEFVDSLDERIEKLDEALVVLEETRDSEGEIRDAISLIQHIAHKLGGVAGSYGFPALSRISAALDEYVDRARDDETDEGSMADRVQRYGRILGDAISEARNGRDPAALCETEIVAELERLAGVSK